MAGVELDPVSLINAAPATALALLVYLELRMVRPILSAMSLVMSAMLERERAKEANEAGHNVSVPRVPTLRKLKTNPGGIPVRGGDDE